MLKLGYKASAEQFAPGPLLDFSTLAEEVGFDSVFVSDHFQPWKHTDGHAPSALVWLGALGAKVGGAGLLRPTLRVLVWGGIAMAITAGVGRLFGAVV